MKEDLIKLVKKHCKEEGVDIVCDVDEKNANWLHGLEEEKK